MSISPQVKGEKIVLAKDDGTIVELTVGEALRAYEAAMRTIVSSMQRTHVTVGRCDKQCPTCATSKARPKNG